MKEVLPVEPEVDWRYTNDQQETQDGDYNLENAW